MTNPAIIAEIRAIAAHVRAIDPDDDQLLADMLEAETDIHRAVDMVLDREAVLDSHMTANKARMADLAERNTRFASAKETGRAALMKLLEAAGVRKLERPAATVSLGRSPQKVFGDGVDGLPDNLVRVKREPDKKAIKAALESDEIIPGYTLSNGGVSLTVRRK